MTFVNVLTLVVLWLGWFLLFVSICKFVQAVHEWLETRWQESQRVSAYSRHQLAVRDDEQRHRTEVARMLADIETQQAQSIQRMYAAADRALSDIRACGGR